MIFYKNQVCCFVQDDQARFGIMSKYDSDTKKILSLNEHKADIEIVDVDEGLFGYVFSTPVNMVMRTIYGGKFQCKNIINKKEVSDEEINSFVENNRERLLEFLLSVEDKVNNKKLHIIEPLKKYLK